MADILPFSANITEETLIASTRLLVHALCFMLADFLLIQCRHNRFPPDTAFPQIDVLSDGFKELCAIIAKYNAQSHFRLRLLHRHMTIPEGHILLGTSITEPCGYWTTLARIPDVDLQRVHRHIISVDTTSCSSEGDKRNAALLPSEFREGPASARDIDSNFFTEVTGCLWANGLENTLGLEAIQGQAGKMIEFSFDIGSLLVMEEEVRAEVREEVRGQPMIQETGWAVMVKGGTVYTTGKTECWIYPAPTGHVKIMNSKAKAVSDAIKILRDEGVLAM
jgi:hypothetical protein